MRRGTRILVVGLILCLTVCLSMLLWPKPRLLLAHARSIAQVDPDWDEWSWVSSDELLLLTTDRKSPQTKGWRGEVTLLNITTGEKKPLPGLTALLTRDHISPSGAPGGFTLSPDRTWLVWHNESEYPESERGAAHLDGTHYRAWKQEEICDSFFADDSHWVECKVKPPHEVMFRDLADKKGDRSYAFAAPEARDAISRHAAPEPLFVDSKQFGDEPKNQCNLRIYRTEEKTAVMYGDTFERRYLPTPLQRYTITLPSDAELDHEDAGTGIGPIAYDLKISESQGLLGWLRRKIAHLKHDTQEAHALWVSQADGKGFHEIGRLPVYSLAGSTDEKPEALQWLPRNRQISFVYHKTLYVVRAEPRN